MFDTLSSVNDGRLSLLKIEAKMAMQIFSWCYKIAVRLKFLNQQKIVLTGAVLHLPL